MKASIHSKLETLSDRHEEVAALLSDGEIIADQNRYRELSREYAELETVVQCFKQYQRIEEDLAEARLMLEDGDAELRAMGEEELASGEEQRQVLELELQTLLLPRDPRDSHNVFLEIRAGTGGDEAAIFSGDLFRMYSRYAEACKWQLEIITAQV
jgi:peptide chain release factor 1